MTQILCEFEENYETVESDQDEYEQSESESECESEFEDPYEPFNYIINYAYRKVMQNYENKVYDDVIYDEQSEESQDEGYETN